MSLPHHAGTARARAYRTLPRDAGTQYGPSSLARGIKCNKARPLCKLVQGMRSNAFDFARREPPVT
eukprot:2996766-Rhodomonas_salina.1